MLSVKVLPVLKFSIFTCGMVALKVRPRVLRDMDFCWASKLPYPVLSYSYLFRRCLRAPPMGGGLRKSYRLLWLFVGRQVRR